MCVNIAYLIRGIRYIFLLKYTVERGMPMYKRYNPNPIAARVGDCTVRAISKATDQSWQYTYVQLCLYGLLMSDMPSANSVWGAYLLDIGFSRKMVPDVHGKIYTVSDFAREHQKGIYIHLQRLLISATQT